MNNGTVGDGMGWDGWGRNLYAISFPAPNKKNFAEHTDACHWTGQRTWIHNGVMDLSTKSKNASSKP